MKKLLLLSLSFAAILAASATDIWVWNNGTYTQMSADSITFEQPAEAVIPAEQDTTVTPVDTTAQDTTPVVTPADTTKQDTIVTPADTTKQDTIVTPADTTKQDSTIETPTDTTKQDSIVKVEKPIFGEYSGSLNVSVMTLSAGTVTATMTVTEVNDSIAKIEVGNFSAMGYTISGFSADSASITGPDDNGTYTLTESNYETTAALNGKSDDLSSCNFTCTIDKNGNMTATISLSLSSGIPMSGKYSGKK